MPKENPSPRKSKIKGERNEEQALQLLTGVGPDQQQEERKAQKERKDRFADEESKRKHERSIREISVAKWTIYLSLTIIFAIVAGSFWANCLSESCSFSLQGSREIIAGAFSLITLALGYLFGRGVR